MDNRIEKLKGKRVLLLAVYFFNYQNVIYEKLKSLGAEVVLYDERSVDSAFERALLKIDPYIFKKKTHSYYEKIIKKHKNEAFDYILIIKCDMPDKELLLTIRTAFPTAKMCLHIWDSIKNIPHILEKVDCFDCATSFDRKDCIEHNEFKFRPLFFSDEFRVKELPKEYLYDLSFCGTIHSDRYKIIKPLMDQCGNLRLKYYGFHYLQSKFMYFFYKLLKPEFKHTNKRDFDFEKKSSVEIANIVNSSKAVIDVQHPRQTGLTMRTIEMQGMKKKLITTNSDIVNYDFYNPHNILVIDREKPRLNKEFLQTPYQDIDAKTYEKYSLECWICDVLGVEE